MAIQFDAQMGEGEDAITIPGCYARIATPIPRFQSPNFEDAKLELHLDVFRSQAAFLAGKERLFPKSGGQGEPKTYFEAPAEVAAAVVGKAVPEGFTPVVLAGDNAMAKAYAWLMQQPQFAGAVEV